MRGKTTTATTSVSLNRPPGHQISSTSIETFARKREHNSLLSHISVTMNEGQDHSHWYHTMRSSSVYHHTKFEINRPVNVQMQADVKTLCVCVWGGGGVFARARTKSPKFVSLAWIWIGLNKMIMSPIRLGSLNCMPNYISVWQLIKLSEQIRPWDNTCMLLGR